MNVEDFMKTVVPTCKDSRLTPYLSEIIKLRENNCTLGQVCEFLKTHGIEISASAVSMYIKRQKGKEEKPSARAIALNGARAKQDAFESFSIVGVNNIDVRIKRLLGHVISKKNDWKWLERVTEISAEKWRQYGRGSTSASIAMLEALGKAWPQYAFWLVTGSDDVDCGHVPPVQINDQSVDLLVKYTNEFLVAELSIRDAEGQGVANEIAILHNRLNFARKERLQLIARKCSLSNPIT